jgi:hypothetical protein
MNYFVKRVQSKFICFAEHRNSLNLLNYFVKRAQSQACLNSAERRNEHVIQFDDVLIR